MVLLSNVSWRCTTLSLPLSLPPYPLSLISSSLVFFCSSTSQPLSSLRACNSIFFILVGCAGQGGRALVRRRLLVVLRTKGFPQVCVCVCVRVLCVCVCVSILIYTGSVCMHTNTHTHTHTQAQAHKHTHIQLV
jgi:hypothetical protein